MHRVQAAIDEWRNRWPKNTPTSVDVGEDLPPDPEMTEEDQEAWHLASGFDGIAVWLGGVIVFYFFQPQRAIHSGHLIAGVIVLFLLG